MSGWLPITTRNRVALLLAALSLVIFVVWNLVPWYDWIHSPEYADAQFLTNTGPAAKEIWWRVFTLYLYGYPLAPIYEMDAGMMYNLTCGFVAINAITAPGLFFFWGFLQTVKNLRFFFALANCACVVVLVLGIFDGSAYIFFYAKESWVVAHLIATSMIFSAISLFTFKNELPLREERNRPMTQ